MGTMLYLLLIIEVVLGSQIDLACTVWGQKGMYDLRTLAKE